MDDREQQIQDINNWAIANPNRVFGDDFKEQRKYLTSDTWNSIYPKLKLKVGDENWKKLPHDIQQKVFNEGINNTQNKAGEKVAIGLAATTAAPYIIGTTTKAAINPVVQKVFDVVGTADNIRNIISDNGISKTIKKAKEGDTWGAVKSGAGDILDILAVGDVGFKTARLIKKYNLLNKSSLKNFVLAKLDQPLNLLNRYTAPHVKAKDINFNGPYKGDWLQLRKDRLWNGGFDKMNINPSDYILLENNHPVVPEWKKVRNNSKFAYTKYDTVPINTRQFFRDIKPSYLPNDPGTWNNAYADTTHMLYTVPTKGKAALANKKFPNSISAHEYGHLVDYASTHKDQLQHSTALSRFFDLDKHELYGNIPGYTPSRVPVRIRNYFQHLGTKDITELQQRLGQLKDYYGINVPYQDITVPMWNYARRHYVKDIGWDNNMQQMFRAVKNPKKFLDFINPYVFKKGGKIHKLKIINNKKDK